MQYRGEETRLVIGDRNVIREYVTMHRGTARGLEETRVGSDNFIMALCHVAHDCILKDNIIMANSVQLAGHITVEDHVVFGGLAGVHQYCRVGRCSMVAGISRVPMDVPPFSLVGGSPARFVGLNRVGLRRIGLPRETTHALRQAYKIIFRSGKLLEEGLKQAQTEYGSVPEVAHVLEFIRGSQRGVIR